MKIEETVEFWKNYILKHPEHKMITRNAETTFYAPYKSDFWVAWSEDHEFIHFNKKGRYLYWHRLDGPAVIDVAEERYQWWINDRSLTKEKFDKHPLVIEYMVGKIIDEVLDE